MKDESGDDLINGTKVTLYLKEYLGEFLEEKKINDTIKKIRHLFDIQLIYTERKQRKKMLVMKKMKSKQLMKKKQQKSKMIARRKERKEKEESLSS
jgi:HSP90 family molecular chaperone